jgi:hypothetical protein
MGKEKYVPTSGLTAREDKKVCDLLAKWDGGNLSASLFTELARMIPQPIVEVVIFRNNNKIIETLLIPRPEDDIVWPGMWHNPGTAIRRSDYDNKDISPLKSAFKRIQASEINNVFKFDPVFVDRIYTKSIRGPAISEIFYTELLKNSKKGLYCWHPVEELKHNPNFIQQQLEHIMPAFEKYKMDVKINNY